MPLGVLSDEVYEREAIALSKRSDAKVITLTRGRGFTPEVPVSLRKIIATESVRGTSASELSEVFEVSKSSVSAYKNGANSTSSYNDPDKALIEHVNNEKADISKIARGKLVSALEQITPERLGKAKLKDVSKIAKDMSGIVKDMSNEEQDNGPKVQFNIYAPVTKTEEYYKVIEVKE